MKNIFGIKGLALSEYAISANAILGIRDSGKTYTATKAAEELFDAGTPWLALDPIGVWHSLRIPGRGKGYPVVVAGGRHGDLPLTTKNVGALVREAMKANVCLVLDLFSVELSKADWKRIVRETVEILMHENADYGQRHVFIEEAAEFVPQRMNNADGQVFAAVEKLVRMGGNSKLGCTLINQRSADLNKSVLELCANVFVHRQTGKNTLMDLRKWFDEMGLDKDQRAKIQESIPNLASGHCWLLSTELKNPVEVHVPAKNSQHPDRRAVSILTAAPVRAKTSDTFIAEMKARLDGKAGFAKPAAPSKPVVVAMAPGVIQIHTSEIEKMGLQAFERGRETGFDEGHARAMVDIRPAIENLQNAVTESLSAGEAHNRMDKHLREQIRTMEKKPPRPGPAQTKILKVTRPEDIARVKDGGSGHPSMGFKPPADGLGKAERAILGVVAHFPATGASKAKVALWAGYSASSGSFRNALGALRSAGLLNTGEPMIPTKAGVAAAGGLVDLPTGAELLDYWSRHSAIGKAERAILTVLVEKLPGTMTKDEVAEAAEYQVTSGSFRNALGRLRTLQLIEGSKDLRAAGEFE